MLDTKYISELKNDIKVRGVSELNDYDRRMLAIGIFEKGSNLQKLSAIEPGSSSFDIIKAIPNYAKKTINDNSKIDLAIKIADSLLENLVKYHAEDIEELFL